MGFEATQVQALPKWLADEQGEAFARSFGKPKDDEIAKLKGAVKLPWPTVGPDDALPMMGKDRSIRQAPIETAAQYRARLLDPFGFWHIAPTKNGIAAVFSPYYAASLVHVYSNHQIAWDGNASWWSRFFILLDQGYFEVDGLWSDPGNYDDGGTWDSTATVADLDYFRWSIRDKKWPGAYPGVIGCVLGNAPSGDGFWNTIGFYDDGLFWDDSAGDCVYFGLGHIWGEEAWYGGGPGLWDQPGDVWDDFFPPSGGWVF